MRMSGGHEPAGRRQPARTRPPADPFHDGWWYLTAQCALSQSEVTHRYDDDSSDSRDAPAERSI